MKNIVLSLSFLLVPVISHGQSIDPPLLKICTAQAGVMIKGSDCVGYSNGCERSELLRHGYVDADSKSCPAKKKDPQTIAIDTFKNDPEVMKAMDDLFNSSDRPTKIAPAQAMLVSSGCGFAGCDETYLVSRRIVFGGTNGFSDSVVAKITLNVTYGGVPNVRLVDIIEK